MNVPILKLGEVLLASIQVDLSDQDAMEFQTDVLKAVTRHDSLGIVIDVSALDVVDSFMARVLNETVDMARLIGAEAVVSGIQPSVALTLIEMGRDMIGVETALNLELGLEKLRQLMAARRRHE